MLIGLRQWAREAHETARDMFVLALACAAIGMIALVGFWLVAAPILLLHHLCRPA